MRAGIIVAWTVFSMLAQGCAQVQRSDEIGDSSGLGGHVGEKIVIVGAVSETPWQHMVDPRQSHPHATYFDMGSGQIVVYSKEPIGCSGTVRVTGTVIRLEGSSKDPRRKETCTEYHVLAESWECVR